MYSALGALVQLVLALVFWPWAVELLVLFTLPGDLGCGRVFYQGKRRFYGHLGEPGIQAPTSYEGSGQRPKALKQSIGRSDDGGLATEKESLPEESLPGCGLRWV